MMSAFLSRTVSLVHALIIPFCPSDAAVQKGFDEWLIIDPHRLHAGATCSGRRVSRPEWTGTPSMSHVGFCRKCVPVRNISEEEYFRRCGEVPSLESCL